jgi:hypothetical protein
MSPIPTKRKYTYNGLGNAPSLGPTITVEINGSLQASGPMPAGAGIIISGGSPLWTVPKSVQYPASAIPSIANVNELKSVGAIRDSPELSNRTFTASVSVKLNSTAGAPAGTGTGALGKANTNVVFREL